MKCNPCSNDLIMSNATHFCKTCEDPEPLCESCAVQHTRQKIAKDHDICDNMANFPRPLENVGYTCLFELFHFQCKNNNYLMFMFLCKILIITLALCICHL